MMYQRIDLHTHSDCSDGVLAPAVLVALAAARQVELLALTDHDTVAGIAEVTIGETLAEPGTGPHPVLTAARLVSLAWRG